MKNISRRNFLKGAAAGIAGTALTGILAGCQSSDEPLSGSQTPGPEPSPDAAQPAVAPAAEQKILLGDILNPQEDFTACTTDYSHIFSPLKIGGVTLKCRIVKSAAGSGTQHSSDWPDDTSLNYYRQFCKGGVGMICTENSMSIPSALTAGGLPDMGDMAGGLPDMDGAASGLPAMDGLPDMDGAASSLPAMDDISSLPGSSDAMPTTGFLMFTDDNGIPAHKAIADAMHELDTPVIGQVFDIMATGCASSITEDTLLESALSTGRMQSTEEVQDEVQKFIDAAERYYKAGFDGIELNASCNHYFSTFLSRRTNRERTDQYSGETIENRCRILTEIIAGIRERLGKDFIVQVLYSGVEGNVAELGKDEGCTTVEEAVEFARLFEKAGASSLHIRSEAYGHHCGGFMPDVLHLMEHGYTGYGTVMDYGKHMAPVLGQYDGVAGLLEVAADIKKNVSIPVGAVGSMDPRLAPDLLDNAIAEGKLDFLVMTRPLMADFELPNKLKEGRRDEVAPCTHCMTCFVAPIDMGMPMYCRVNPALTRAYSEDMPEGYDPLPADVPRNVMVIGGGPAGMEAARIAAQRGHHVKLYEKAAALGGRLDALQKLKGTHERILDHKAYLIHQLELNGVEVVTGQEADAGLVESEKPDAVVVAVGSLPAEVDSTGTLTNMTDLLSSLESGGALPLGNEVVILGAQFQACEIAVNLCKAGKKVTMLNPGPENEFYMNAATWPREMGRSWLRAKGVKLYHNVILQKVSPKEVTFQAEYGVTMTVSGDDVINALPEQNDRALFNELSGVCDEVYAVGNCYSPSTIANATARANLIARKLGAGAATQIGPAAEGNTYSATATGIGDVTVTITVEDGKITKADVDTSNETAGIGRDLGGPFAQQIMDNGNIDAVSGATLTSNAVREALAVCKQKAGIA